MITQKQKHYPLLLTLNLIFTSHIMSVLLYDIVKLSQEFPKSLYISNILKEVYQKSLIFQSK